MALGVLSRDTREKVTGEIPLDKPVVTPDILDVFRFSTGRYAHLAAWSWDNYSIATATTGRTVRNGLSLGYRMSMLLCHECYSWVEPRGGHCPDCMAAADINEADPPLSRLQAILGEIRAPLGEVTVRRRALPGRGLLYATTNGLYFLPHLVVEVSGTKQKNPTDDLVMWSIASALWAPLSLCAVFMKLSSDEPACTSVLRPQRLAPEQADAMPRSLMENPGAFFVPSAMIQSISRRFGAWIIHRGHSTKVKLVPVAPRETFDDNMFKLIATPPWKHVVT